MTPPGIPVRVCAVILNNDEVCLIRRHRPDGDQHSLPGGIVNADEDVADAQLDLEVAALPQPPALRWVQDQHTTRPGRPGTFRRLHLIHVLDLPDDARRARHHRAGRRGRSLRRLGRPRKGSRAPPLPGGRGCADRDTVLRGHTWDTESRLTSVTTPDGTRWRYRYDPLGRRTAKQRLAADSESVVEETRFTWDGLTLCEQTTHQAGTPNAVALTWDHRDVAPLAQTERILTADGLQQEIDSRFYAIATDLVGTPTELIDETGDIAWRTRSTLWGTTAWARDSSTYTPLRFPGQYYDPETGLHYNLFRHYDPETGRYTSPRPPSASPPHRTRSATWTTRTAGATHWG